jgi:hypothetical protein
MKLLKCYLLKKLKSDEIISFTFPIIYIRNQKTTARLGESATHRLDESATPRLDDLPTLRVDDSLTRGVADSPTWQKSGKNVSPASAFSPVLN